jgi:integrase
MVEVLGKDSSSSFVPAGSENALAEEWHYRQTYYPPKEPQLQTCPQCGSKRIYRDGFRDAPLSAKSTEPIQRFRCADYGHRFSRHTPKQSFKKVPTNKASSQISVILQVVKNLAPTQEIKTCAEKGKQSPTENEVKASPQIERLLIQLRNDGRTEGTVENYRKNFKRLLRQGADLFNPENSKEILAKTIMAKNAKRGISVMLNIWFDFNGIKWKRPRYAREAKIPYIPTQKTLNELIAGLGKKMAAYCQVLLETGARAGEISALKWESIDFERKTVNIVAEKGSNPRILKLSQKALDMAANLKHDGERPFSNADDMRSNFFRQRRRLAQKLANPDILKVHFHSFRHFKATIAYHETKDLIHVQELLGHKNIEITRGYIYIEKSLFQSTENDKFHAKIATTRTEMIELLESGFEYVTQKDGLAYFRKRK